MAAGAPAGPLGPMAETGSAAVMTRSLENLEKRAAHIQYAAFAAQGYLWESGSKCLP